MTRKNYTPRSRAAAWADRGSGRAGRRTPPPTSRGWPVRNDTRHLPSNLGVPHPHGAPGRGRAQKNCSGEAIFAVQTGTTKKTGVLNYVLVASSTNAGLTHWLVGYAEGKVGSSLAVSYTHLRAHETPEH